jgi:hypothetical protein
MMRKIAISINCSATLYLPFAYRMISFNSRESNSFIFSFPSELCLLINCLKRLQSPSLDFMAVIAALLCLFFCSEDFCCYFSLYPI